MRSLRPDVDAASAMTVMFIFLFVIGFVASFFAGMPLDDFALYAIFGTVLVVLIATGLAARALFKPVLAVFLFVVGVFAAHLAF